MRNESLDRVATAQLGLFTRHQALAVGLTARQIDHGANRRLWDRLYAGVYRMAGVPPSELQALLAAVMAAGPGAVASHRSAAWLWDMGPFRVDVSGPLQRSLGPSVHMYRRPAGDLQDTRRRGVPCTNPLRTVLDLAATGDEAAVEEALDRSIAAGLLSPAAVESELGRRSRQGRRGVQLLRACLEHRLDRGGTTRTSVLESAMNRLIVRFGLPAPERQHPLDGGRYFLDYAWPAARVVVEVDGYRDHSSLAAFRSDRARQNALVLGGWTVLRFTWDEVRHRPASVATQILAALAAAPAR
ncbi:MAG: DUF559 domain-containing protein [Acidimicrobiales bacterium]